MNDTYTETIGDLGEKSDRSYLFVWLRCSKPCLFNWLLALQFWDGLVTSCDVLRLPNAFVWLAPSWSSGDEKDPAGPRSLPHRSLCGSLILTSPREEMTENDQTSQLLQLEVGMAMVTQGWTWGRVGNTMTMRMFLGAGYGVWIQLRVVISVSLQIRSKAFMQMTWVYQFYYPFSCSFFICWEMSCVLRRPQLRNCKAMIYHRCVAMATMARMVQWSWHVKI